MKASEAHELAVKKRPDLNQILGAIKIEAERGQFIFVRPIFEIGINEISELANLGYCIKEHTNPTFPFKEIVISWD